MKRLAGKVISRCAARCSARKRSLSPKRDAGVHPAARFEGGCNHEIRKTLSETCDPKNVPFP
jgi:hypothetical protein